MRVNYFKATNKTNNSRSSQLTEHNKKNITDDIGWFFFFLLFCVLSPLSTIFFSYIMATSFSGGGSRSIRREPPTMGKKLVNCFCNLQSRFDMKWCIDSTSFKEQPCNSFILFITFTIFYCIKFTIFYYNTISLKRTICFCSIQTESYSLHVMQLVRI